MSLLFGLAILLTAAVVTFVLPVFTFVRISRLMTELHALRARVASLEQELRDSRTQPTERSTSAVLTRAEASVAELKFGPTEPGGPAVPAVGPSGSGLGSTTKAGVPATSEAELKFGATESGAGAPAGRAAPADSTAGLEAAIGGHLLLYAGVVAFVLGIGFFVKYAFENEWVTEGMRVALGALSGLALVGGGLRLTRRGYDTYGNILIGGGLAALYVSTYAALDFYALIGRTTASLLLIAITAAAAGLADRQRHQGLAVMAVGGGFLTPFLVGGTTDAQITLFSYVALLVAGTMVLARRRDWPLLNVVSYGLTVLTVAAWADVHYRPSKYLRTHAFLTLYCAMFLVILRQSLRSVSRWKDIAQLVLWSAPVLYHLASIGILQRHDVALPVYLILFALAGVAWSVRTDRAWLRLLVWVAAMLPFLGWMDVHQSARWTVPSLATLGALFALPLLAQSDRVLRRAAELNGTDLFLLHLNALGTFAAAWLVLDDIGLVWVPRIGLLLALVHASMARWLHPQERTAALHALAAAFALLAAAIGVEFDSRWLTVAWAAEGAAIVGIGLRVQRDWFRMGGALLLATAAARWIVLSAPVTPSDFTLVFNESFAIGAWIITLMYLLAWSHRRAAREDADRYASSTAALIVAASGLTVVLLSTQNASYWKIQGATMADATFAEGLALSLLWAVYGGVLIAIGIGRRYAPIRYAAIVLIGLTVLKVFLVDLSGLEGIYRVLGLLAVGAVLLIISFLYQRGRGQRSGGETAEAPPAP